jgi:PAS domain S-box-containing protein
MNTAVPERQQESERTFIVDSIPGLVALLSPNGEVEFVNRELADYFGQTLEELKSWGSNGTVHPDDLAHVVDVFGRSIAEGVPYDIEQRLRRGDGVYRWIQNRGFPLRDSSGAISGWCVLLIDIDERRRAEAGLRQTERELRLIIDTIPALVWSAGPNGRLDYFNQHSLEFLGLTAEEATSGEWAQAVHPDDEKNLAAAWKRILTSEQLGETEARLRRHDGEYRWVILRANPLRDESGKIVRWYGINIDIDDRKRGETLLKESEQRFRTLFEEAGAGITLLDLTPGTPIQTNRAMQKMLDSTADELRNVETFTALTAEGDRETDLELFVELRHGKRDTLRQEKHFILKNGRSVWANVIFTLLRDIEGTPRSVISIHEDITERKIALEELKAKQELLDLAQKAARAMAFDWYIQEDVNTWSPEQESLYGLEPGTFDGRYESWKALIYPPDWPGVVKALASAKNNGEISAEYRVVWPDGSLHWLMAKGQMFLDEGLNPRRMVGFTADITERKLVEEELRRSEAFLAEGQHLAKLGNFSWGVTTERIMWSEQLYRIFEFEPGTTITLELIGSRVHPDDMPMLHEMVDMAQRRVPQFEFEHRLLMPDGSIKHLHLIAHRTDGYLDDLEYIGAVQDVTQRQVAQEALSDARSELARTARMMSLGVLTASIAHEVNQPLSGIVTNASTCVRMLDADPPNIDGARETARRTIRDGNRASDVIARLRALFRKKDSTIEPVDLNEAVREVLALSRSEFQKSQLIVQTELEKNIPLVDGDRVQLQQVILNLLLNAADSMKAVDDRARNLTVATSTVADGEVRVSVRDEGTGFAAGDAEKLFSAFYTTKEMGMGIGLSVSRSIIESHRGRLWATPNDGPGATFCFSIPCAAATSPKSEHIAHPEN